MPTSVLREDVQRLLEQEEGQLVEVLPRQQYEAWHLAGAKHISLRRLNPESTSQLDPDRPLIVYCYDARCDMSPRAAARLEALGFTRVFDYVPGKVDWAGAGLPLEGADLPPQTAGNLASPDVATCLLGTSIGDAARAAREKHEDQCVVLDSRRVVHGLLRGDQLTEGEAAVEDIMELGPVTTRPDEDARALLKRLCDSERSSILISNADGTFVGTFIVRLVATQLDIDPDDRASCMCGGH